MQKTTQTKKLNVLFLCTGNSCRSQMAEGWGRHLYGQEMNVFSAGIQPKKIDSRAVQVMQELNIDLSNHTSKHVNDLNHVVFDLVITVCGHAAETCPMFPGRTRVIHKGFDDPPKLAVNGKTNEDILNIFRRVRDEIGAFLRQWKSVLISDSQDIETLTSFISTL